MENFSNNQQNSNTPELGSNYMSSNHQRKWARIIFVVAGLVLVLIAVFVTLKYTGNSNRYLTYAECVKKTKLPCKHYFVGDMGQEWKPSTYQTKEECDTNEKTVGSICVVPDGSFKDTRWISSVDLQRAEREQNGFSQKNVIETNIQTKLIDLAGKYTIKVPVDYKITKISEAITKVPVYGIETSDGHQITVSVNPYKSAESKIEGECIVSKNLDSGTLSAPIFCEGLTLTDSFSISGNLFVKYASLTDDTSMACTANSPCPVKVAPETKYSKEYVFVIPDKSNGNIVEFFAGDAARGPTNSVVGFEGVSQILHDSIIPSLTAK